MTARNSGVLDQIFQMESRSNPYPLFSLLHDTPVSLQHVDMLEDGDMYFVSGYREVEQLIRDPRISSDVAGVQKQPGGPPDDMFFDQMDGPEHHRRRARLMHNFGPPNRPGFIDKLATDIEAIVHAAIDKLVGQTEIDLVKDFAYPVPVDVICRMLGVPSEDEDKFHQWSQDALSALPRNGGPTETQQKAQAALADYMGQLIVRRRANPKDDFLSAMIRSQETTGMSDETIVISGVGLLIAGHETTVNLLANGILTLLRNPDAIDRIRADPDLIVPAVEEILRMEPPSQMLIGRVALNEIEIAGSTIPKGAAIGFSIAGANRDPAIFTDPDTFRLDRVGTAHFTFGSGAHFCFGAPLARLEGQIGLKAFVERFHGVRLLQDPPPYRESPVLRGPGELRVLVDKVS